MSTTQESERVLSLLQSFALRITRNSPHAEDLAQYTLIKVWLAWDSNVTAEWEDDQFQAWFYQIMKNAWIDTQRKLSHRPQTDELTDDHYAPGRFESDVERREMVNTTLSRLTTKQRTLLILAAQGYPYEEMAKIEQRTISGVGDRLRRARIAFREEWNAA